MVTFKKSLWFLVTTSTIILLAAAGASAQDCETYELYGAVTDEAGKAVPGALVEFLDVQTKGPIKVAPNSKDVAKTISGKDGRYAFSILNLPNIENGQDFTLRVSKSGFIAHEEKINIYLCGFKRDVKMLKDQSGKSKTKSKRSRKTHPVPPKK